MGVQNRSNNDNTPLILNDYGSVSKQLVIAQDGTRSGDLVTNTLLAKIAATGLYVPFTDETATDGSALPAGVYVGPTIAEADIQAGNVDAYGIIGGAVVLDKDKLVIENSKTLATVIGATSVEAKTVEDVLNLRGIFLGEVDATTSYEN